MALEIKSVIAEISLSSRDQKRSGHTTHRSRSRSADGHRRPQTSPFFIAKGAKHGEKEFPLRLLKHTKTRPPLSYCENPETAAPPQPTTRKEAFATEHPDVVNIMQVVTEASSGKDVEGKEQAAEPSGLAALRVSYEGGDEDDGDDETKRQDRPWFPDASSFMSDSEVKAHHENNDSLEEDGPPIRVKEEDISNEFDAAPDDALMPENLKDVSEEDEEENIKEEKVVDKRLLLNESESIVHSRWDSDPDSRGMSALEAVEKNSNSPNTQEMQEKNAVRDERKRSDERHDYSEAREGSDSDDNLGSENSEEDSEIEEKKGQQLASEYEEFMKAVSVGGEDDDAGDWGSGVDDGESGEDHQESDSSEHNSSKQNNATHARSSEVELGSDVHSSDDEAQNIAKHSSSESDNSAVEKAKSVNETKKRIFGKKKLGEKKDSGKLEESDGGCDSDGEMQVPRKKRKLSAKKSTGSGEIARKRGSEEKKKKLKVKEKSQKKKREKEKKRKKKKEKKKKRGRKKEDSSDLESESEEASDDAKVMSSGKSGRTKQGERKRLHKGEQSSDEATTDNSSDSSEEEEKKRKKRKKKKKRHAKEDGDRTKDEVEENVDEGKKGKVHSGKKKKGHESKNKRGGSDNSDCSEEKLEEISHSDEKVKLNAACDESVNGKENGIEEGSGKGAKKQKLKERGRKKKRKGSPINTKKHNSTRRRSPSTSDGSPTPGRGSHSRESISKVQGRRGGTNESGQSSLDSNSSGGNKKPGDSSESLRHWESSRVGGGRCYEEARTTICERGKEPSNKISTSAEISCKGKKGRALGHKEKSFRQSTVKGKRSTSDSKRIVTECSRNTSSSSSSPSSLSSVSSSSSSESSFSSQSDSTSSSTSSSSSSSSSNSSTSSMSTSSSSESSSVSSFPCSPPSSKVEAAFCEEVEPLKDERLPAEMSVKCAEICDSFESDPSCSPVSKEDFLEEDDTSDFVGSVKLTCKQTSLSETLECGQVSHLEQYKDHSPVKSIPKAGSSESKFISNANEPTFRESSETDVDAKSVTNIVQRITALPSRPSRWDTRPVGSGMQAGSAVGKSVTQEWELPMSGLPVLPVPFPTCQSKPIEDLPSSIQGVPKPVASPWGVEAAGNKSVLPSSDLSLNPIRGLADSTISDSELGGKCVGIGGQQQVNLKSSKGNFSVALERPHVSDHRTISSENDEMVELYARESDHFVQPSREGVNMYLESRQQFHPADDRLMEHDAGGYAVDESCSDKKPESASMKFGAVRKDYDQAVAPETESAPTDWDDPEAFVGSGLGGIKSHVIQVGNFLQVVPSEQPIVSRAFSNPTPPVPAAVPLAVASTGVPLAPVPPATVISGVPPVAAPISSASVTYPSPIAPLSSSFQSPCISSPSSSSIVLPSAVAAPAVVPPLSVTPVSPSLGPVSSPVPSNIPTSIPTVASLIPSLTTAVPTHASPTPTLSQIPLLASLAPASSCAGISQLPLDPAAFLGSLISHALAFEKQQQTLLQSPSCSPLVVGQGEEVPKELPINTEKETKKIEKRKKVKGNLQSSEVRKINFLHLIEV
ncbi:hypothetical protein J437_LFUL004558 [Ladona fulva]|uniref:Uncharacterized protein n=1 Tax=Ladona fulva TaxID=123851 RepID=A0A8K0JVA8_LADFU|nr:hypothetical protein J437_LFUL004558 [Ladona fulva]